MRRGALALLVLLVAAPPAGAATTVHVTSTIAPHPTRFGDVLHATIVVRASARATVLPGFSPFAVLRSSTTSTSDGGVTVTTVRVDLQCLEAVCAPGPTARTVRPSASQVRVGGKQLRVQAPAVRVVPRVTERQVGSPARWLQHPTQLPAPGYRFAPGRVRELLLAAALVLVVAAALLLLPVVRPRRVPAAGSRGDPLARALALVRAARSRPPADRRRALALLARTLREREDPDDAGVAGSLAWSEPEPDAASMTGLADHVEGRG
jgi:hypothetical protein